MPRSSSLAKDATLSRWRSWDRSPSGVPANEWALRKNAEGFRFGMAAGLISGGGGAVGGLSDEVGGDFGGDAAGFHFPAAGCYLGDCGGDEVVVEVGGDAGVAGAFQHSF